MTTYTLFLELNKKTLPLFPEAGGLKGTAFQEAIAKRIRAAFNQLNGVLQSVTVSTKVVKILWQPSGKVHRHVDQIASLLSKGNYADSILLLEIFLTEDPDNPDLLYNLGMAYSDQQVLGRAIQLLTLLSEVAPDHVNGHVALGVALMRANQEAEGVRQLQLAVEQAPDNPWARRNLGAALMMTSRPEEAEEHLKRATELSPEDQGSWYGYGQALDALGRGNDADAAYNKAIVLDEFSEIAEQARQALNKLAHKNFKTAAPVRMDAVSYCLSALEAFEKMSPEEVQKIGFEIALLGARGIDVNKPDKRYTLKTLPGDFSGLRLICLEYVAFQKIAPDQDIGFDLSKEYQAALSLFFAEK